MSCGFLECTGLLPAPLCSRLAALPMEAAEGISNSFQLAPPPRIAEDVRARLLASSDITTAVEATFGTRSFKVTTLKVLMTELGAEPQIPHADDFCNRELFGVVHLRAGQAATESAPYDAAATYPTGVWVQCEACESWFPLPDWVARRREHLTEGRAFTCARGARVRRGVRLGRCARHLRRGGARRIRAAARAPTASDRKHGAVRRAPRLGRRSARTAHPRAPRAGLRGAAGRRRESGALLFARAGLRGQAGHGHRR